MQTVNVSSLKNNPSEALRSARNDLVVVMNRDQPDAVMIGLQSGKLLSEPGARAALATALFRDGGLSLARGARMAQMQMQIGNALSCVGSNSRVWHATARRQAHCKWQKSA